VRRSGCYECGNGEAPGQDFPENRGREPAGGDRGKAVCFRETVMIGSGRKQEHTAAGSEGLESGKPEMGNHQIVSVEVFPEILDRSGYGQVLPYFGHAPGGGIDGGNFKTLVRDQPGCGKREACGIFAAGEHQNPAYDDDGILAAVYGKRQECRRTEIWGTQGSRNAGNDVQQIIRTVPAGAAVVKRHDRSGFPP